MGTGMRLVTKSKTEYAVIGEITMPIAFQGHDKLSQLRAQTAQEFPRGTIRFPNLCIRNKNGNDRVTPEVTKGGQC